MVVVGGGGGVEGGGGPFPASRLVDNFWNPLSLIARDCN